MLNKWFEKKNVGTLSSRTLMFETYQGKLLGNSARGGDRRLPKGNRISLCFQQFLSQVARAAHPKGEAKSEATDVVLGGATCDPEK